MSHTPGPWRVRWWHSGQPNLVEGALVDASNEEKWHGRWVCLFPELVDEFQAEQQASARLIAAAPELLEALKAAMQIIGHPDDSFSKLAAQIITKAEGK